jgi:CubicO group peptidase (beta-lactamase class C family)
MFASKPAQSLLDPLYWKSENIWLLHVRSATLRLGTAPAETNSVPSSRRTFLQQLTIGASALAWSGAAALQARGEDGFARSTPEAEGVSSEGILAFLDAMAEAGHELHSFMILRRGRVVAEGWWDPYGPSIPHSMYSLSKSFTSMAVGFAREEGKLQLHDKVISYFPRDLPPTVGDYLAELQIEHLLTMSVGHASEPTGQLFGAHNWAKVFLAHPIVHAPGTFFLYNSAASYMCSAIVQAVTGQRIVDYLQPRLFGPLGIAPPNWETSPSGIDAGGWGLSLQTEALARFGQTLLDSGRWGGRQVIPAAWVTDATSFHIQQPDSSRPGRERPENDWLQGYGYQFWRCRHGAFRADGALGQFVIVSPELDALVVMTGESADMQGELDLVWNHLLPAIGQTPLQAGAAATTLHARLRHLSLAPPPAGAFSGPTATQRFDLESNSLGLTELGLSKDSDGFYLTFLEGGTGTNHVIAVGVGRWREGLTALPGVPPRQIRAGIPPPGTNYRIAAAGSWASPSTFTMVWRYYDTPQFDTVTYRLEGDRLTLSFEPSLGRNNNGRPPQLRGRIANG